MLRLLYLAVTALVLTLYSAASPAYPAENYVDPYVVVESDTVLAGSSLPYVARLPSTIISTTSTLPIVQATTSTTTTTTTITIPLPDGKCSEWFPLAVEVGWPIDRLDMLGRIMWAESRCLPDVSNCCSYGLTQMEWSAHKGWLLTEFGVDNREKLYDPTINLLTALWLAEYAEEHYGCWSQPWYMSGDWC